MEMDEINRRHDEVVAQEAECVFSYFDHKTAWDFGHFLIEEATKRNYDIAVRINLDQQIVFQYSMPGTRAGNDVWLQRKIDTVYYFGDSTERVALSHAQHGTDFYDLPWIDKFKLTKHGGGFPIRVTSSSAVVGAIAMSNAHGHEHGFIVECIRAWNAR